MLQSFNKVIYSGIQGAREYIKKYYLFNAAKVKSFKG